MGIAEIKENYYSTVAGKLIEKFERRGIEGHYFKNSASLVDFVKKLIPEKSSVSWGGSMTLLGTGVLDYLKTSNFNLIDREKADTPEKILQIYRDAFSADYYFTGSNAITMDGKLVNIDGTGNRVAAICCGPSFVLVVAGMNKVVKDEVSAMDRIKNFAAPMNSARLSRVTPCVDSGKCEHCLAPECICSQTVITRRSGIKGRIKVLLVGETHGF